MIEHYLPLPKQVDVELQTVRPDLPAGWLWVPRVYAGINRVQPFSINLYQWLNYYALHGMIGAYNTHHDIGIAFPTRYTADRTPKLIDDVPCRPFREDGPRTIDLRSTSSAPFTARERLTLLALADMLKTIYPENLQHLPE